MYTKSISKLKSCFDGTSRKVSNCRTYTDIKAGCNCFPLLRLENSTIAK